MKRGIGGGVVGGRVCGRVGSGVAGGRVSSRPAGGAFGCWRASETTAHLVPRQTFTAILDTRLASSLVATGAVGAIHIAERSSAYNLALGRPLLPAVTRAVIAKRIRNQQHAQCKKHRNRHLKSFRNRNTIII